MVAKINKTTNYHYTWLELIYQMKKAALIIAAALI